MNRYRTLAVAAALSSMTTAVFAGPLVFVAKATLTSPTPGQVYNATHHPDNGYYAKVTISSSDQSVQVTGGQPNGELGISYTMNITVSGSGLYDSNGNIQEDSTHGGTSVHLNAMGGFMESALSTGSLSSTLNTSPLPPGQSATANAHSEITYNLDSTQKSIVDKPASFSVVPSN